MPNPLWRKISLKNIHPKTIYKANYCFDNFSQILNSSQSTPASFKNLEKIFNSKKMKPKTSVDVSLSLILLQKERAIYRRKDNFSIKEFWISFLFMSCHPNLKCYYLNAIHYYLNKLKFTLKSNQNQLYKSTIFEVYPGLPICRITVMWNTQGNWSQIFANRQQMRN